MQPAEITKVALADQNERLSCDGGGGVLGHPTVYFALGDDGKADCYYCGRRFELESAHAKKS